MSKKSNPCKDKCHIKSGQCTGCFRSICEIKNWKSLKEKDKENIIKLCKKREEKWMEDNAL